MASKNTIAVSAVFEARKMRQGIDEINGRFGRMEKRTASLGRVMRASLAGGAVLLAVKDVVGAASKAEQSLGATETVFGKHADKTIAHSKRAAKEFGLSANEYRENANLIGSLFKNQGIEVDKLAGKTKTMIRIGGDLAATFGGTTTSAVEALSSAFKGEFDPLERYGVSLKQSTVNTESLRVANVKSAKQFGELSLKQQTAAKQQATTNLILKQSKDSTGAFARESGTLANQQQVLMAQLDNVKVALGTRLLPVLTKAFTYVNTDVIPALDHTADAGRAVLGFFDAIPAPVRQYVLVLGGAVLAMRLVNRTATATSGYLNNTLKPAFWNTAAAVTQANTKMLMAKGAGLAAGGALLTLAANGDTGSSSLGKVATVAGSVATGFAVAGPWGAVAAGGIALLGIGKDSEESARRQQSFLTMQTLITSQAQTLTGTLNAQSGAVTKLTRETLAKSLADNGAYTAATKVGVSYKTVTQAALGNAKAQAEVDRAIKAYTKSQFDAADGMDEFLAAGKRVEGVTKPLKGSIDTFSGSLRKARTATNQTREAMRQMAADGEQTAGRMARAGSDAGRGFHDGLAGWLGDVSILGARIGDVVAQAARDRLEIKSPSRVMRRLGQFVGQGMAQGIIRSTPDVRRAASRQGVDTKKEYLKQARDLTKSLLSQAKARYKALADQRNEYDRNVTAAAKQYGSLSNLQLGENETLTAERIQQNQRDRLASIQNFGAKLYRLRKAGLSTDLYNQITQMGVEEGTAYVEALAKATPATLKGINTLQGQINAQSSYLGKQTSNTMYGAGVASAQGFYNGLASLTKKVDKQGIKMAKSLVKALKKALGIKSPSRVFAALGKQTVQGLQIGLDDRPARRSGEDLAKALRAGFKSPRMDAQLVAGFNASAAPAQIINEYNITLRIDNTMTEVQMGVQLDKALKAAKKVGAIR